MGERITEQQKIVRVLKILKFLSKERTIIECAEHVQCSNSTIYKYIQLFNDIGYTVDRTVYNTGIYYSTKFAILKKHGKRKTN